MNEQKGLLTRMGEALDQYRAERRVAVQPDRRRWLGRQLMPNFSTLLIVAVLILTQNVWAQQDTGSTSSGPSATTVNYQGQLADNAGMALDGTYGMSFALYDAATDGNLIWGPEAHTAVEVSDGLFSVGLGSKTSGGIPTTTWSGDRYLEITVDGETLEPRELIRSVPISGMALTVPDGSITDNKLVQPVSRITMLDRHTALLDSNDTSYPIDGEWHDVDISGKIPDTVKAVIVQIVAEGQSDGFGRVHIAPGGEHQTDYLSLTTSGNWHFAQGIVKVINGNISYLTSATNVKRLIVKLVGYVE